jgi:chromosome segregation ATPase
MKSLLDDAQSQSGHGDSTVSASHVSSSKYSEIIEEVEKVTEELLQTEEKLWETQDSLKDSDEQVKTLQTRLSEKEKVFKDMRIMEEENCTLIDKQLTLREEINFLKGELAERDKYPGRPEAERRLKKAVDFLQKDLEKSKEKYRASEHKMKELQTQVQRMDDLEALVERMKSESQTSKDEMECCREQMNEAREESTNLVEEVAKLQVELREAKTDNRNRERVMEERITKQVKERLTMTVREDTTKQVTQKVTREVKTEMKAASDKDLNALREQFKRIFKDNSILKGKLQAAESSAADTMKLEEDIPKLKYEISGLVDALNQTKNEQEVAFGELESFFRVKVQAVREQAAKDKWDHAAAIRHQMTQERDFEVSDFSHRFEALSRETEVLLDQAAREKEIYAAEIRKQFTEEKQREVIVLTKRINELSRGSDAFVKEAAEDKETYAEQVRKQMQEEKRREVNKYSYRLEALTRENEALERRIVSFEEELSCSWKENESNADLLKTAQTNLKVSQDSVLRLKRKNQNLNTLVDRYKEDHAEGAKELAVSKKLFRESLMKSEEKIVKMSEKIKTLESSSDNVKRASSEASVELERSKNHYSEALDASEKEVTRLTVNNNSVNSLLDKWKTEHTEVLKKLDQFKKYSKRVLHASESEITTMKKENQDLTSLLDKWRSSNPDISETLDQTKDHFRETMKTSDEKMARLKEENKSLNSILEELNESLNKVSAEKLKLAEKIVQMDTSLLQGKNEVEEFQRSKKSIADTMNISEEELTRLKGENQKLEASLKAQLDSQNKILVEQKEETGGADPSTWNLVERIEDLKYSLDRYRGNNPESGHTSDLNREIKTLNHLLARYKNKYVDASKNLKQVDGATSTSEEEIARLRKEIQTLSNLEHRSRQHQSETSTERDSLHMDDDIRSESSQVYELNEKIQSLTSVLEQAKNEHSETLKDLESYQDENSRLEEKVNDLDYMLVQYRDEHAQTSKELEKARQLQASDASDMLKEKVISLNILVEKFKTERIELLDELDTARRKCKEVVDASEKKRVQFMGQIQNLNSLLAKSKSGHSEVLEELHVSRQRLNSSMEASANEVLQLRERSIQLESLLDRSKGEESKLSEELLHSKRLFNDELVKSEDTIFKLKEQIRGLRNSERKRTGDDDLVAKSQLEQHALDSQTIAHLKETMDNFEILLETSRNENLQLSNDLETSNQEFQLSLAASVGEAGRSNETIHNLKTMLDKYKNENSKISKELEHSMQLFKEALVAWREETRVLRQTSHADSKYLSTIVPAAETRDSPDTHPLSVYRDASGEHREGGATSESSTASQLVSDMGVTLDSADGPIFLNPTPGSSATEEELETSETLRGERQTQNWREEARRLIEEVESSKKYGGNAAIDTRGAEDERDDESGNLKLTTPFQAKRNPTEQEVPSVPRINETGALEMDDVSIASESTPGRAETDETSQIDYRDDRDQDFDCRSHGDDETQESRNEDTTVDSRYSYGKSRPEQARFGWKKRVTWKMTMTEFEGDQPPCSGNVTGSIFSVRSILKEKKATSDRQLVLGWEQPIGTHDGSALTRQVRMESEDDTIVENATMDDTIASASKDGEPEIPRQNEYQDAENESDSNASDFEEAILRNKRDSSTMDQSNRSLGIQRDGTLTYDLSSSSADTEDDEEDQNAGDDTESLAETILDDIFWPEKKRIVRWKETNDLFDPIGPIHEDDGTEDEMVQSTASNMDISEEASQDTIEMTSLEESTAESLEFTVEKDDEDDEDGTVFSEGPESTIGDFAQSQIVQITASTMNISEEASQDASQDTREMISLEESNAESLEVIVEKDDEDEADEEDDEDEVDEDEDDEDGTIFSGGPQSIIGDFTMEELDSSKGMSNKSQEDTPVDPHPSLRDDESMWSEIDARWSLRSEEGEAKDRDDDEHHDHDAKSGDQHQEDEEDEEEDNDSQNSQSLGDGEDYYDDAEDSVDSELRSENDAAPVETHEDSHFQRPTEVTRQESMEFAREKDQLVSRMDQLAITAPTSISEHSEMRFSSASSLTISDQDTNTLNYATDTILDHHEFPESPTKVFLPSHSFTPPRQRGRVEEREMAPVDEYRELGDERSACSSVESHDMLMNIGDDWQDEKTTIYREFDVESATTNFGQDVDDEEETLFTTERSVHSGETDIDDTSMDTAAERILLGETADQVLHQFRMDAATHREHQADFSRIAGVLNEVRTTAEPLDTAVDVDESFSADTTSERREAISGFHRSLEKVSRRQWSRRDIRRFCYKKSTSKKTPPSSPSMAEMVEQSFEAFDTARNPSTDEKADDTEAWDFRSLADSTDSTDRTTTLTMAKTEQEGTMDTDEFQILPAKSE